MTKDTNTDASPGRKWMHDEYTLMGDAELAERMRAHAESCPDHLWYAPDGEETESLNEQTDKIRPLTLGKSHKEYLAQIDST